ncbi:MAG: phospholipase D family protein [Verrucomicrobiales bacterium]|nr:phospholipase D family protein [Verrucomicrobiales bacterium]
MKVLTKTAEMSRELVRLIEECSSCQVAVAWASIGFTAFDLLLKHSAKVARMIVGTHFYQTNPQFIEAFYKHPNVRFIMRSDGVFHPKVYLFLKAPGQWECLIGSPNFTQGGFDFERRDGRVDYEPGRGDAGGPGKCDGTAERLLGRSVGHF